MDLRGDCGFVLGGRLGSASGGSGCAGADESWCCRTLRGPGCPRRHDADDQEPGFTGAGLLARFGRTVAAHVVEHVEERGQASREPGLREPAGRDGRASGGVGGQGAMAGAVGGGVAGTFVAPDGGIRGRPWHGVGPAGRWLGQAAGR